MGDDYMALAMDEKTFLSFYKSTMLGYSINQQKYICNLLEEKHLITFEEQANIFDSKEVIYFDSKGDIRSIISQTTMNKDFINFYEWWEYTKLYKYSVPFFYYVESQDIIKELEKSGIEKFEWDTPLQQKYVLNTSFRDITPTYYADENKIFIKFVVQKTYMLRESLETIDYRYPVIIYIDLDNHFLEIRYDALKYSSAFDNNIYARCVDDSIDWLKKMFQICLYECDHANIIDIINSKQNEEVKIYKQMMEMSSGGSAELTASESRDYVLPFVGEIRELIDENSELFDEAEEVKQLLLQYLSDKEATASYPYIYIKWIKPVESQSYIVKVTFDYFNNRYTLLQHITGSCKDLGMERMNNAIEYLCKSGSFVKGEAV